MKPERRPSIPLKVQLRAALIQLGLDPDHVDLDHDPALKLRYFDQKAGDYAPAANDPRYMTWRARDGDEQSHAYKTNVDNGTGRSDKGAIAHLKRSHDAQMAHASRLLKKYDQWTPEELDAMGKIEGPCLVLNKGAPPKRKRKIASRTFPKQHRKLQSRRDWATR